MNTCDPIGGWRLWSSRDTHRPSLPCSLKERAGCRFLACRPAPENLHVGVAGAQHGREPGRLFLAAPAFARLLKMPVNADNFQRSLTVDSLLQSPQGLFNGLAFFQFNLGQTFSLPLQQTSGRRPPWRAAVFGQGGRGYFRAQECQTANPLKTADKTRRHLRPAFAAIGHAIRPKINRKSTGTGLPSTAVLVHSQEWDCPVNPSL